MSSTDIVKAETDRLTEQKKSIDDAMSDKRRLIVLNDSYRKRMTSYTFIAMGITAGALCMLAISFLPIPTIFSNILYVCIIMGVFILILYRYDIISQRSRLDYDELNLPSIGTGAGKLSDETKQEQASTAQAAGQLSAAAATDKFHCVDKECCPNTWDDKTGCKDKFTTLTDAYSSFEIVKPYTYSSPLLGGLDAYSSEKGIQFTSL